MTPDTLAIAYLVSGVLFIFGLKGLTSPATARRGNYLAISDGYRGGRDTR